MPYFKMFESINTFLLIVSVSTATQNVTSKFKEATEIPIQEQAIPNIFNISNLFNCCCPKTETKTAEKISNQNVLDETPLKLRFEPIIQIPLDESEPKFMPNNETEIKPQSLDSLSEEGFNPLVNSAAPLPILSSQEVSDDNEMDRNCTSYQLGKKTQDSNLVRRNIAMKRNPQEPS